MSATTPPTTTDDAPDIIWGNPSGSVEIGGTPFEKGAALIDDVLAAIDAQAAALKNEEPGRRSVEEELIVAAVRELGFAKNVERDTVNFVRKQFKVHRPKVVPIDAARKKRDDAARPGAYPHTDHGLAERLVARHGPDIRYCSAFDTWFVWRKQGHFARDERREIERLAKETVRAIAVAAEDIEDGGLRDATKKFARESEAAGAMRNMLTMARSEAAVAVGPEDFDTDRMLFNCANGTIDLRTQKLRPHRREDLCLKASPVVFDEHAKCPTWEAFLERVQPKPELRAYVQRFYGRTLSGDTSVHDFHIFYGAGRNGKGTSRDIVAHILGTYFHEAAIETFLATRQQNPGGPREDLVAFHGPRLICSAEIPKGARLDEALVKRITGGDPITTRAMHGKQFTFHPKAKFLLLANARPHVSGTDAGIWRRMRLVPWSVEIPEPEVDTRLAEKLRAEAPGILNWLVAGCAAWLQDGMQPPEEVVAATEEYRAAEDVLAVFIEEDCFVRPDVSYRTSDLLEAFNRRAKATRGRTFSASEMKEELSKRGFGTAKKNGGYPHFLGITLRSDRRDSGEAGEAWGGSGEAGDFRNDQ